MNARRLGHRATSFACSALAPFLVVESVAIAAERPANPSNYREVLATLVAGDTMRLAAGRYGTLLVRGLNGNESQPITISGPESGDAAVIVGSASANAIGIRRSSYVVVRKLDVDLAGQSGIDAVKVEFDAAGCFAHHVTIEHLHIYGFAGGDQQPTGISTKCPVWDIAIRHNTIRHAGTGMYLGNSSGDFPFVRGIIEHNLVVDPIGYGMEIKHQTTRPTNVGLPTSDSTTIVRHNVFIKATRASTGDLARPNLLVGAFPNSGPGANDRYQIYGNFLFQNASGTEPLFQGEGRFSFHDNVLLNGFGGGGVLVRAHNGSVKDIDIYDNTIHVRGTGISISNGEGFRQRVVGNAIFADIAIRNGAAEDNVTDTYANASRHVANPSTTLGVADYFPRQGQLIGAPIDLGVFSEDIDYDLDFNARSRSGLHRGAYEGEGANPGWGLAESIKTLGSAPAVDAGVRDAQTLDLGPPVDVGLPDIGTTRDARPSVDADVDDVSAVGDGSAEDDASRDRPTGGTRGRASGACACNVRGNERSSPSGALLLVAIALYRRRRIVVG